MKILRRYWGLVALALLLTAWWTTQVGPGVLYLLSGAVVLWSLFQAPAWCGAATRSRGGFCRNNSRGLLLGCHLREHRWQKFKMLFYFSRWAAFSRGTWATPSAKLATVSGLVGSVSAIATGIKDFALS
ncbi:hypothetical protein JOD64_001339 [Micromonospora luteifusca]|uniref:Uncharacterized protein n=1 Tax=Micromonospora luteifusca TaxID=709860 RepID=A0ABS2LQ99_9ACTN|nr:hypothetical protein [Micromonospora luteifusca]MBM7490117.1 hypothetical protein [Micromonospora luteifusca]